MKTQLLFFTLGLSIDEFGCDRQSLIKGLETYGFDITDEYIQAAEEACKTVLRRKNTRATVAADTYLEMENLRGIDELDNNESPLSDPLFPRDIGEPEPTLGLQFSDVVDRADFSLRSPPNSEIYIPNGEHYEMEEADLNESNESAGDNASSIQIEDVNPKNEMPEPTSDSIVLSAITHDVPQPELVEASGSMDHNFESIAAESVKAEITADTDQSEPARHSDARNVLDRELVDANSAAPIAELETEINGLTDTATAALSIQQINAGDSNDSDISAPKGEIEIFIQEAPQTSDRNGEILINNNPSAAPQSRFQQLLQQYPDLLKYTQPARSVYKPNIYKQPQTKSRTETVKKVPIVKMVKPVLRH